MENVSLDMLAFLLVVGFIASFIDSVVGGGGLITLPALMLTGLEPIVVLGTNKAASVMGSFTSSVSFIRSGKAGLKMLKYLFPLSLLGSVAGVYAVHLVASEFLRPLVVVMLVLVTLYSLARKDWGEQPTYNGLTTVKKIVTVLVAVAFGFYDGFFGPGTGSFLLFYFLCLGFDFVGAAANARVLNFASNIAAAVTFSYLGLVNFHYAVPMGIAMILGAIAGTRMAIKKGAAYVKPLFIVVTVLLIGRQVWELL